MNDSMTTIFNNKIRKILINTIAKIRTWINAEICVSMTCFAIIFFVSFVHFWHERSSKYYYNNHYYITPIFGKSREIYNNKIMFVRRSFVEINLYSSIDTKKRKMLIIYLFEWKKWTIYNRSRPTRNPVYCDNNSDAIT